jgi:2-amino-4-hydroxy-6-hydroxymethyldihydropteridine diphosphokinase
MARCLVSFGANLGDPRSAVRLAADLLRDRVALSASFHLSRFFRTPPIGGPSGQPPFFNAVANFDTKLSVWDVWHCVRSIETELGRVRNQRWEARPIDLDILLYDQIRIWTPHLKVPHPRMCMRRFILLPAMDVAADYCDPVSGWTIAQLAENVRSGPANLLLIAPVQRRAVPLLAEVARRASARWLETDDKQAISTVHGSRWVALRECSSAEPCWHTAGDKPLATPEQKLLVVLAPKLNHNESGWEDTHRALAVRMDLVDEHSPRHLYGPRYLLADNDNAWALEELVAALDAMDCPVELAE